MVENAKSRIITIGLSGPSSGGKTTVSRYLKSILPNSTIVHQDDFYRPEADLPLDPKTGLANWDCPEAIDFQALTTTLGHVKEHGRFPDGFDSLEEKNPVGSKETPLPVSQEILDALKKDILDQIPEHERDRTKFVILDGFILYVDETLRRTLDVKFFLTAPYQILKERRESRKGYATLEDPPGYFDDVVWPNYLVYNAPFVRLMEEIQAGRDTGVFDAANSNRSDSTTANIDIVSSGNATIHEMVETVSRLLAKRLSQLPSVPREGEYMN
ncbi:ribosylnicotinamide kinase [Mortierella alpina]|uniref:Ribosylnicotinamide kinase n=1 Tax=Mortierella alpina TaxID=64518 RepID=A0A9P6M325_MORAP|nr:ribosylnicotinamide kinase [Mortierella alpina]